ncbi:MAG: hypothetical protein ACRDSR_02180 [Pseudonocardiaceae bacterium]
MVRRINESERIWSELEMLVAARRLPERTIMALFDAALGLRVRNRTYRSYFADGLEEITEATATRDLRQLVEADLLMPRDEQRARYYVALSVLRRIRENVIAMRDRRDDSDPFEGGG